MERCNQNDRAPRLSDSEVIFLQHCGTGGDQAKFYIEAFDGNPNCRDQLGKTALYIAIMANNRNVVEALAQRDDLDVSNHVRGQPPIIWAVRQYSEWLFQANEDYAASGEDAILRILLRRGVRLSQPTPE